MQAMLHTPPAHPAVPPEVEHCAPQPPQWFTSVKMVTSHPFAAIPSQSAYPAAHAPTPQRPAAQAPVACAGAHAIPHVPQCAPLVAVSASHPFAAIPSQSAKGAVHPATLQAPPAHAEVPFATAHDVPQPPQFATLLAVSTHPPAQHVCPVAQA